MSELDRKLHSLLGDKTFSPGCKFIGRYGEFSGQTTTIYTLSQIEKQFVRVREGFSHSYEQFVTLYFPDSRSEFFYEKTERFLSKKMFEAIRKQNKGNFCEYHYVEEIIGHEPTIADLHRLMNENVPGFETKFEQTSDRIIFYRPGCSVRIKYDSSKSLLSQSEETKKAIIELITSYS